MLSFFDCVFTGINCAEFRIYCKYLDLGKIDWRRQQSIHWLLLKLLVLTKKVVFTPDGRVITYKNNVEIRNSAYQMEKGSSFFDQSENDLITFEGKTYIIENLDNQNLTIVSNNQDATRTIFKR